MNLAEMAERLRRLGTDLTEVEVKAAAGGFPKDLVETLSAFANGTGGVIILGLVERDGFKPAPNFDARAIRDALAETCSDRMEPPLRVPVDIEEFEGALVVVAEIPELDPTCKPCHVKGRGAYQGSFIRCGDGDRQLGHYEVSQLLSNRTQPTYDQEAVESATIADLDADLVQALLRRVRGRNPRAFQGLSDEAALVRLNVVTLERVPTLGGLLSVGAYPQQFLPQLSVAIVVLPGAQMGELTADGARFVDNVIVDGSIPVMLEAAAAAVQRNMRRAAVVNGLFREDRYDYPLDVIRELLVNALMHRDYSPGARGAHIQVELYRNRLVVKSPGGIYGNVVAPLLGTPEQGSSSRNAALAKILAELPAEGPGNHAISENRGSGLPNVMSALRRAGMSPAEFDVTPDHVHVIVRQSALLGMDVVNWIESLGQDGLSDSQHLALAMMRSAGRVTNGMLQAWGVDRAAAGAALRGLVNRGLATASGGRRYASYYLAVADHVDRADAPALPAVAGYGHSSGIDAEQDAIVQAIEAGNDTARALGAALGMSYQSVLRRLRKLIDQGIVERAYAPRDRRQRYRPAGGSTLQNSRFDQGM